MNILKNLIQINEIKNLVLYFNEFEKKPKINEFIKMIFKVIILF
jgi:hypothetical protein